MNNRPAYFISDAHLGIPVAGQADRQEELIAFLRTLSDKAESLFIVGDFFDFWIEYRYAIRPDYFPVLHELRRLVEAGVTVHYIAGNHDFAMGNFLSRNIGMNLHSSHFETVVQGKKIYLVHGDGILRKDRAYRLLRSILRNRFNQGLFKILHPSLGIPLARFFSGSSRLLSADRISSRRLAEYKQTARSYCAQGNDIVIFAHTHRAELVRWGEKVYCNTGNWLRQRNYAILENGIVRLWNYNGSNPAREIAPENGDSQGPENV
jgi:UDP-2,3-diacylglucosamine hydrolase